MARRLKNWLRSYLKYTEHSESPERFHFWTGVSTIAGVLRRKVWIDMGYFEWTPNFFVFLVAPPGIVSKSTSANIGMDLLRKVEGIKFGPSALTWQGLVKYLSESTEAFPLDKDLLGQKYEMSAITVLASELGTLIDPNNREMVDVLVDLWDGRRGDWMKYTKLEGAERIVNPWINILACTTPAWIADNVNTQFISGGFASRSIFVFSEMKRRLVAYPFLEMHNEHADLERELVNDLTHIANFTGRFHLSRDALEWGGAWYAAHYQKLTETTSERFAGSLARKQTHIHKLAMILSAATRDDMQITELELKNAEQAVSALELDMPRAFSLMNKEQLADYASEALQRLADAGRTPRDVFFREYFIRKISYETFNKVLDSLVNASLVVQVVEAGRTYLVVNKSALEKASKNVAN